MAIAGKQKKAPVHRIWHDVACGIGKMPATSTEELFGINWATAAEVLSSRKKGKIASLLHAAGKITRSWEQMGPFDVPAAGKLELADDMAAYLGSKGHKLLSDALAGKVQEFRSANELIRSIGRCENPDNLGSMVPSDLEFRVSALARSELVTLFAVAGNMRSDTSTLLRIYRYAALKRETAPALGSIGSTAAASLDRHGWQLTATELAVMVPTVRAEVELMLEVAQHSHKAAQQEHPGEGEPELITTVKALLRGWERPAIRPGDIEEMRRRSALRR